MSLIKRLVLHGFLVLTLTAGLVWAQDAQEEAQQQAPPPPPGQSQPANQPDPSSRVARLQYMSGSVSIQPHGTDDWVAGSMNRPLTNSDNVWTDKDSRVELNVGTGVLRMNSESSLTLTNVGDSAVQVELHQGTLNLRVRHLFDGEVYEVDTPNLAFTVQKNGEYRFDVDPAGDASVVTVWKGEGDATGNGPSIRIKSKERARFTAGNSLAHEISPAPVPDGFDDWARVRDQREDHSVSAQYVAPGVIGYEDLDAYGSWRADPTYGSVWFPSGVAVGWAPYHSGHWVWISPWGWTWVDDEPWGFAPYHYGRWIYSGGFWGWTPGPYYYRPFYAPALVAWFGGSHWGAGFGFGFGGGIGWCPLGWGEPFVPWYHTSRFYFERVNLYNTRFSNFNRVTNNFYNNGFGPRAGNHFAYSNLRAPGGAVAISQRTLVNSMPVRGNTVNVSAREFEHAGLGNHVPVSPDRTSMLGSNAGRASALAPSRSFTRPVVSRMQAPAGARMNGGMSVNSAARPATGGLAERGGFNSGGFNRSVPRPPQSMSRAPQNDMARSQSFGSNGAPNGMRSVPRPPNAQFGGEGRSNISAPAVNNRSMPSSGPAERSVPRPSANPTPSSHGNWNSGRSSEGPRSFQSPSQSPSQNFGGNRGMSSVPRPTGPVRPAPSYNAEGNRSWSGSSSSSGMRGSYGMSQRSYESPRYSSPVPSWSGRSSGPSYSSPAPSYRGGGYSAPSNRSYSAPSSRAAAPSYHGGGGGGGGYSHSSGGGGGGHGGGGRGR